MLSPDQIKKFQLLYERRFGKKIDEKEALERGMKVVALVKLTHRSSPEDQKDVARTNESPEVKST